jgi:hypothetical protein
MGKTIVGVIAGLAAWVAIIVVAGMIMRLSWPAYASVADAKTFTLPMLVARLSIGALATVSSGCIATLVAPESMVARLLPGLILLVAFIPQHIALWETFPVWYHLTFLLTLVPPTWVGGSICSRSAVSQRGVRLSS